MTRAPNKQCCIAPQALKHTEQCGTAGVYHVCRYNASVPLITTKKIQHKLQLHMFNKAVTSSNNYHPQLYYIETGHISFLTEAIPLYSNKFVYCTIFRQYTTIQGLSKRFERFKFGIFYVLIVKIRYNFTHK